MHKGHTPQEDIQVKRFSARVAGMAVGVTVALALVFAVACGGDSQEQAARPAGGGSTASAPAASVDQNGAITIIGKDNVFEPKAFTAKAGQKITVNFDNKGAAIHNFQLVNVKGPDGQEIQTPLIPGNQKAAVEFTLQAGSYDYYCVVHPVEMRGKITVQ
jgi:plastocyanin